MRKPAVSMPSVSGALIASVNIFRTDARKAFAYSVNYEGSALNMKLVGILESAWSS